MHITILTVGSRGDIQPYLALSRGLVAAGHHVRFATELGYKSWVEAIDLEYAFLPGDTKARHAQSDWLDFLHETRDRPIISIYRCNTQFVVPALRPLLDAAWEACQGTDAIISMPSVFGGQHIAEKLNVPFYSVWTSAFTPTSAFPHSWSRWSHQRWLAGAVNRFSYWIMAMLYGVTLLKPINQWRKETLNLPPIGEKNGLQRQPVPTLYAFSPTVVPKPPDWDERVEITGYWFLDSDAPFQPPADLVAFLEAEESPLYIGFGSTADVDPRKTIQIAIEAVQKSGRRAVLEMGWANFGPIDLPPQIFRIEGDVPHPWLFPRMAALIHHGGAGTTGQGLRHGKPTLIVYQKFVDFYFWGQRIAELGVGPCPVRLDGLLVESLVDAIQTMMTDSNMRDRAAILGQTIRAEDGVARAVEAFQQHLEIAGSPPKA